MNKVILMGRLTKDVELRSAQSGTSIARFNIAVDRRFKRDGQPNADFFKCVAFGGTADFVDKYFHKGNKILLEGEIQNNNYESDGQMVYDTQILISNVEFCESKSSTSAQNKDFVNVPDGADEEVPW